MSSKKSDVWSLLDKRFPSSGYALLAEVRDKAGLYASRAADGVAMNLWPSRGLEIEGIEIKSYRSDWLSELKRPEKAENIFKYCDRWWLIATEENLVKKEELPKTWGFMEIQNGKLKTIVDAPKLTPVPPDKHFVAAMLKRATKGMISISSIQEKIDEARELGETKGEQNNSYRLTNTLSELSKLKKEIQEFKEVSGIDINSWNFHPKKIGEAVRFVSENGVDGIRKSLLQLKKSSDFISKQIETGLSSIDFSLQLSDPE